MTRIRTVWTASERWLAARPHVMTLILLAFTCLFAGVFAFRKVTGDEFGAQLAAGCMALAMVATLASSIHLIYIRAGQTPGVVFFVDEAHRPADDAAFAEKLTDLALRSRSSRSLGGAA